MLACRSVAPIAYLTTVEFGAGALSTLPDQLTAVGMTRPLIVSDRGLAATGLVQRIERLCPPGAPVFLDVPPNPTEAASRAALAVYHTHRCDGLCSVGGGSPIDLAKCVALLASHSGPLESYAAIYGGISRITGTIAPVIAIPTTAGTGSEVGRAALITLDDGRKLGFISPHLIPRRAVCDPELTIGKTVVRIRLQCQAANRTRLDRNPVEDPKQSAGRGLVADKVVVTQCSRLAVGQVET